MSEWGNPALKTFKRRFVRNVRTDTASTWVHVELAPLVRELLLDLGVHGTVPAYLSPEGETDTTDPRHYGVHLHLPLTEQVKRWGFEAADGAPGIVFAGGIDDARHLSEQAQVIHAARIAGTAQQAPVTGRWGHNTPGIRALSYGDKGDDVQFLQYLLGARECNGVFAEATDAAVRAFQRRAGLEETGDVGAGEWRFILPRHSKFSLSRSDAGFRVRTLQAMLAAYDWASDLEVTGTFNYLTALAVKELQQACGLRITGYVREPEWTALFGRKLDA